MIVAGKSEKKEGGLGGVELKTGWLCDPTQHFFFPTRLLLLDLYSIRPEIVSAAGSHITTQLAEFSVCREKKILRSLNQSLDPPIKNFWIRPSSSTLCHRGLTSSKC